MPKFVIEREIPGAGELSARDLKAIAQKSCRVLDQLAPRVQWLHSHVTGERIYCLYIATDAEAVLEHARLGGFPANRVSQVVTTLDPTTAE